MNAFKLYRHVPAELAGSFEVQEAGVSDVVNFLGEEQILKLAEDICRSKYRIGGQAYTSPNSMRELITSVLDGRMRERFLIIGFDNQKRYLNHCTLFEGTIDAASVYPREVVKWALDNNAASVVFAHNHPSGVTTPSLADRAITRKLIDALVNVDIKTLDHFIVGEVGNTFSFAERGMM